MIVLEVDNPLYTLAYDFLVTISEPVARPQWVHNYQLTPFSLFAASAVNYTSGGIIRTLNKLCKTAVPSNVEAFIRGCTERYGKVKLVLKDGRVLVEGKDDEEGREILRFLSRKPEVLECRVEKSDGGEGDKVAGEAERGRKEGWSEATDSAMSHIFIPRFAPRRL